MRDRVPRPGTVLRGVLAGLCVLAAAPPVSAASPPLWGSASAYAAYFWQPGLDLGLTADLRSWQTQGMAKRWQRQQVLFAGVHTALFARRHNHLSLLPGARFGVESTGPRRGLYSSIALGLNYLAKWQVTTIRVNLGSGATNSVRELRNFVLPALHYRFGKHVRPHWGWFLGAQYGITAAAKREGVSYFGIEVGTRFRLDRPAVGATE